METAKIWRGEGIRRICYGNYQHTVTDITIERNCDVNTGNVVEITYEVPEEDELGTQPEMGTRTDLLSGVRKLRDEDRAGGTLLWEVRKLNGAVVASHCKTPLYKYNNLNILSVFVITAGTFPSRSMRDPHKARLHGGLFCCGWSMGFDFMA